MRHAHILRCALLLVVFGGSSTVAARCVAEDSAAALAQLRAHLHSLLSVLEKRAQVGVLIADTAGRTLFAHNADAALVPASTTKLFWTAAALALFGDTAAVRTRLIADAPVGADGVVRGNLYLVGGGDALLTVHDLEELAEQLVRRGVRRITGALLADGSLFDGERSRLHYSGDVDVVEPLPPITALGVERNRVRVLINVVRGRVTVQTLPLSPAFRVDASGLRVVASGERRRVRLHVHSAFRGGVQHITLQGRILRQGTWSLLVPMERPEAAAAAILLYRLRAVGISVDGGFGEGRCDRPVVVLAELARPLSAVLAVVNKESDNFVAEHLFKLLGATASPAGRQAERARQRLQELLWQWGIACDRCQLWDGSGLSRRNRVSAADVVGLLRSVGQQPFGVAFRQSLAVGGVDGTLQRRLKLPEVAGRLWAKTGTLRNASALAGYVLTGENELWLFAILSFGAVSQVKALEDSIVTALARFRFCPP